MTNDQEAKIRLKVKFSIESCDRGQLLQVPETGQMLLLNESAAFLLERIEEGAERPTLTSQFAEHFSIEQDMASSDVDHCLYELTKLGIIEDARF